MARAVNCAKGVAGTASSSPAPYASPSGRPNVYEFMESSLRAMSAEVTRVLVHALDAGGTFHARVYFRVPTTTGTDGNGGGHGGHDGGNGNSGGGWCECDVDARPSDSINLALRAGARVFVRNGACVG